MLRRSLAALLILAAAVLSLSAGIVRAESGDYKQSLAQAKVYMKQERYREAVQELRDALNTREGDKSFEAHLLYAQASLKTFDISQAVEFARLATELTSDPRELSQAQDLYNYLTLAYGKVEFVAEEGGLTEGYLVVTPGEPILDADIQAYFDAKVRPLADQRRSVPWLMWMPAGLFLVNGKEFNVIPGETTQVSAAFTAENIAARDAEIQKVRDQEYASELRAQNAGLNPEARVGYSVVPAGLRRDDGLVASLTLDLAAIKEVGQSSVLRLGFGPFVTGTLTDVSTRGTEDPAQSEADLMVGALARVRLFLPGRVSLFPAVGLGWGTAGGASVWCDRSEAVIAGDRVTFSNCSTIPDDPALASPMEAYVRVGGFGPVGRVDVLFERPPGSAFRGVTVGVHTAALMASTFDSASRQTEVVLSDDPSATPTTVTEELDLSGIDSRSVVVRAGVMIGARMAF